MTAIAHFPFPSFLLNETGDIMEMNSCGKKMLHHFNQSIHTITSWDFLSLGLPAALSFSEVVLPLLQEGKENSFSSGCEENAQWYQCLVKVQEDGYFLLLLLEIDKPESTQKSLRDLQGLRDALYKSGIVSIADREGKIIDANQTFCDISQYSLEELLGRNHNIINSRVHPKSFFKDMWKTIASGKVWRGDICNRSKDGSLYWVDTVITPLFDENNKIEKYLSVRYVITNRVLFEEQLLAEKQKSEQHERKLQSILSNNHQSYILLDESGFIVAFNRLAAEMIRVVVQMDLLENKHFTNYLQKKQVSKFTTNFQRAVSGNLVKEEKSLKQLSGQERWYSIYFNPAYDTDGTITGVLYSVKDITREKINEAKVNSLLGDLQQVYNNTPAMLLTLDSEYKISSVSDYCLRVMGYHRKDLLGKSPLDFLGGHSKAILRTTEDFKDIFSGNVVLDFPMRWRIQSGQYIQALFSAIVEKNDDGRVAKILASLVDITILKKTQSKLRKNELSLIEAQKIGKLSNFIVTTSDMKWTGSDTSYKLLGWSQEVPKSVRTFLRAVPREDLRNLFATVRTVLLNGEVIDTNIRFSKLDNDEQIVLRVIAKLRSKHYKNSLSIMGTVQDITESFEHQTRLKDFHEWLTIATEAANIGVWGHDFDQNKVIWNDNQYGIYEAEHLRNASQQELVEYFESRIHPDDQSILDMFKYENIRQHPSNYRYDFRLIIRDSIKYIQGHSRVIYQKGQPVKVIGINQDITHQKLQEATLKAALNEKSMLLKEVHHRVKNNMQLISSILSLKKYEIDSEQAKEIFEESNKKIRSMAIAHDKLYQSYDVSQIDITQYLEELSVELKTMFVHHTDINLEVRGYPLMVNLDIALSLGLIVNEMVMNAFKHGFPEVQQGNIIIKTWGEEESFEDVRVWVLNDGLPIPPDFLSKMDQFSGLGMMLIQTFVNRCNGKFKVSNEDDFTGFEITLPRQASFKYSR